MGWTKLESKIVYANPWMEVREASVINPRGGRNQYGYVHFKNRAVAIVPIDDVGNTWLVGQDRFTLGEWSWEVPMGGAPLDEDMLESAKRELKEETGLTAARWTEVLRVHTSNSITDECGIAWVAEDLTAGDPDFGETEALKIRKLPLEDAIGMAKSGAITDAISMAVLFKLALIRSSKKGSDPISV